jgi:hypothetical protein
VIALDRIPYPQGQSEYSTAGVVRARSRLASWSDSV